MTDQDTTQQGLSTEVAADETAAPTMSAASRRPAPNSDAVESKRQTGVMRWVRIAAGVALACAALLVWFDAAPSDNTFSSERASIEAMDDANNLMTEGAPQQEVVNGWTTIEYLNLLSKQQEQSNNRLDALLLLALLGGSAALITSRGNARA